MERSESRNGGMGQCFFQENDAESILWTQTNTLKRKTVPPTQKGNK